MAIRRFSEDALIELIDAAPDGILLVGAEGRIKFSNLAAQRLFGYGPEEMRDEMIEALVPGRYHSRHLAARAAHVAEAVPRPMGLGLKLHGLRRDGSEFPVEISLAPTRAGGEPLTITIVRDETERRALEEQHLRYVRASAFEEIIDGLDAIVWESSTPDRSSLTFLGGREPAFLGYPRDQWLREGFWLSVVHSDDRITALTFAATALEHDTFELEYRLISAEGVVHQVREVVSVTRDAAGELERVRGVIVDMTERHELEKRLSEAQKMEAVGQLAGGIAHDFNNLLTIVSGYAQRLRSRQDIAGAHAELDQVIAATERAAELTRQLLAFARRGKSDAELLQPSDTIRALEPMLRRLIDADIVFDFRLDDHVPRVMIDRAQLEQILMNLIINASDAMPGGGRLTVATRTRPVTDTDASRHGALAGDYVEIAIVDSGAGMSAGVRDRIFEPFFTTKRDKGTGMGLATVYGIVDQAGGWLEVQSEVGQGATFAVLIPAAGSADPAPAPASSAPTLLLVEDEAALRQLVVTLLEEGGFHVLQAGNGLDAIAIAERHSGPIDLLVTDVVMPRLSGPELARKLQALRPGLDVLYMSGYNDSRLVNRGIADSNVHLLVKPFTPDQLLGQVRDMTVAAAAP